MDKSLWMCAERVARRGAKGWVAARDAGRAGNKVVQGQVAQDKWTEGDTTDILNLKYVSCSES